MIRSCPANAQSVLAPVTSAAIFLVVTVDEGGEDTVRDILSGLAGLQRSIGSRVPDAGCTCVVGIGSDAWDRLYDGPRPAHLHPFVPLTGPTHSAPATPGDLLFHVRASRMDVVFELAAQVMAALGSAVTTVDEVHGFAYFEQRDLMGFVDGTENPTGTAADRAVMVADDAPFFGGSYVMVQKYLHDLDAWNALTVEDQESVIGRSKLSNIEMGETVKPPDSHTALTVVIDDNGDQLQILRDNMSFGRPGSGEYGTYFIGYSATPSVTETMLRNMFLGRGDASHDRILDFSTAVTGTLFFVPTVDFLEAPPGRPPTSTPSTAPATLSDGSLGIGSLKTTFEQRGLSE
ncbi:Dyp-type peroxidase [Rhodococcus sp. 077-4]|uniref:Dyp-type peroxidase n=1 Tax=Rhodococcus sp. 077-4 TaxID=2789271 RepID=UPI0039F45224